MRARLHGPFYFCLLSATRNDVVDFRPLYGAAGSNRPRWFVSTPHNTTSQLASQTISSRSLISSRHLSLLHLLICSTTTTQSPNHTTEDEHTNTSQDDALLHLGMHSACSGPGLRDNKPTPMYRNQADHTRRSFCFSWQKWPSSCS